LSTKANEAVDQIDQALLRDFIEKRDARDAAKAEYDLAEARYQEVMEVLWRTMDAVGVRSVRITEPAKLLVATHRVYPKVSTDIDKDDAAAVARAKEVIEDYLVQVGEIKEPETMLPVNLVAYLTVPEHISLTKLGKKSVLQQVLATGIPVPEVLDLTPKPTIQVRSA